MRLEKKNRVTAIKEAKNKARYLLNAINEHVGKPIIIKELENNNQNFVNANFINNTSNYKSINKVKSYKNKIVEFEKIKISSTIYVKFQIK